MGVPREWPQLGEEPPLCLRDGNGRFHPIAADLHIHRNICELFPEITLPP
jgi:hypothetical protein